MTTRKEQVAIGRIRVDGGTQTRAFMREDIIDDYANAYAAGETLPPVIIFDDGADLWMADGFHRLAGATRAGLTEIPAEICQGTVRDALLHSAGCNSTHGLRRSNEDKRYAVKMLLQDEEWANASDRWIAEKCNVSHPLVASVRESVGRISNTPNGEEDKRSGRDGRSYKARKVSPASAKHSEAQVGSRIGHRTPQATEAADPDACIARTPFCAVPDRLKPVFECVPLFEQTHRSAAKLANLLEQVEATEAFKKAVQGKPHKLHSTYARSTALAVKSLTPARPCPECGGKYEPSQDNDICRTCGDRGYLTVEEAGAC